MPTPTRDQTGPVTAAGLLDAVRHDRAAVRAAETELMLDCLAWAAMHPASGLADAATVPGTDHGLAIAGEGVPLVSEFAVVELAAALGRTVDSAKLWLGRVLEAAHRLPGIWRQVEAGQVDAWRALRVAEHTQGLSWPAATWVDAQLGPRVAKAGVVALERLVAEAIERFDPVQAEADALAMAEQRRVHIETRHVFAGLVHVDALLDEADARDLDAALAAIAGEMREELGNLSPQVRRALALGELVRREVGDDRTAGRRDATLYVHLDADAPQARVEQGATSYSLPLDRLREWLTVPGSHVSIRPIIDLPRGAEVTSYTPSELMREHVVLRRAICAFPHYGRPARRSDLDHIESYDTHGPPGQTNTDNLAPLCRLHHRAKTHGGWTYVQRSPGDYLWRGPHHQTFHVGADGTLELLRPPARPPSAP